MAVWETRGLTEAFWRHMDEDKLSSSARLVKIALMHFTDVGGTGAFPSVQRIGNMTGLSPSSVRRSLRALEDKGHVRTKKVSGRTNAYTIIAGVGTVTVSDSEGPDLDKSKPDSIRSKKQPTPKALMPQKRGDLQTEIQELGARYQALLGWSELILPGGDDLKRVEQALEKSGFEACLRAIEAFHSRTKETKSTYLGFWLAFPALRRNNNQVTNQLDEARFRVLVMQGQNQSNRPSTKRSEVNRPRADKEDEFEKRRLDSFWERELREALKQAKKQNKSQEEANRYAQEKANKATLEEIKRGPLYSH